MNQLIYLVYPLMAFLLLWGCRLSGKGQWNEEAFSLKQMKALQGFFAICIMLHHIGQKTCAGWLQPKYIIPGLELFVPFGYYFVGFFLFCSGYGLCKSYQTKPDYLKGFGSKRILPIVLSYYVTGLIFLLERFLMKEPLDGWKLFFYISGLKLSVAVDKYHAIDGRCIHVASSHIYIIFRQKAFNQDFHFGAYFTLCLFKRHCLLQFHQFISTGNLHFFRNLIWHGGRRSILFR